MARESYVFDPVTEKLVPKAIYRRSQPAPARSDLPRPMILSDAIAPGISQVSGRYHDTRSGLMQDYRDYEARTGKQVEIVGDQVQHLIAENSRAEVADEAGIDRAIRDALEKVDA